MDSWFACHPKAERLFQHNLIKNNQGQLTILDIEYAGWTSAKRLFRLDMLGVYKADDVWRLVVFENKFGGGAIGGAAGIAKHYADIVDILSNPVSRDELVGSVIQIAGIKAELGLLREPLDLRADMPVEILFVMAGFNMKSQAIANEVRKMKESEASRMQESIPAKICFQDVGNTVIDYGQAREDVWVRVRIAECNNTIMQPDTEIYEGKNDERESTNLHFVVCNHCNHDTLFCMQS